MRGVHSTPSITIFSLHRRPLRVSALCRFDMTRLNERSMFSSAMISEIRSNNGKQIEVFSSTCPNSSSNVLTAFLSCGEILAHSPHVVNVVFRLSIFICCCRGSNPSEFVCGNPRATSETSDYILTKEFQPPTVVRVRVRRSVVRVRIGETAVRIRVVARPQNTAARGIFCLLFLCLHNRTHYVHFQTKRINDAEEHADTRLYHAFLYA